MKKILLISLMFNFFTLLSCKKVDQLGYTVYTIKENRHRSTYKYKTTKSHNFNFSVIFDTTAVYETEDPLNQADVNKLYGISDCGCNHKDYSIRVGWRWFNGKLEILWFRHLNGNFEFEKITDVDLDFSYDYNIMLTEDYYIITVDGIIDSISRPCNGVYNSYYLYPYFGGDEKAPHDIVIKIK